MRNLSIFIMICLLFISVATSQTKSITIREDQMSDRKAIESAISDFVKAYNAGDITRVLAYYGDDLIKLRNGSPLETKSDVARRLAEVFDKYRTSVDVVIDETHAAGDIAFTRGSFRVTLTPKAGGNAQIIERRYLEIWRKERGRWGVVRTMDNIE